MRLNASLWAKVIHVGQRGCERYRGKINIGSGMDKLATLSGKIQGLVWRTTA